MGIRIRALTAVLYPSGLCIWQALALQAKDIDVDAGEIRVRDGCPVAGGAHLARHLADVDRLLHGRRAAA